MEYRQHRDSDTWHWSQQCPRWPTGDFDYEVCYDPPITGERCATCARLSPIGQPQRGPEPAHPGVTT